VLFFSLFSFIAFVEDDILSRCDDAIAGMLLVTAGLPRDGNLEDDDRESVWAAALIGETRVATVSSREIPRN